MTWQRVIHKLMYRTLRSHVGYLTYVQYVLHHCRHSLFFVSYTHTISITFGGIKLPQDDKTS